MTGRSQIKIKIKSADQKTADFVIEKDVRARATATAEPYSVKGGSWLACDSINSVCLMYRGVCIAGKPAPTERQIPQKSTCSVHANPQLASFSKRHAVNCGSGLARECGVSVTDKLTDPPHSRASPLPHLDCVASGRQAFASHLTWLLIQPLRSAFRPPCCRS